LADVDIPGLDPAGALTGDELIELNQLGGTKRASAQEIADLAPPAEAVTKAEVEAVFIGEISSHTHPGGSGPTNEDFNNLLWEVALNDIQSRFELSSGVSDGFDLSDFPTNIDAGASSNVFVKSSALNNFEFEAANLFWIGADNTARAVVTVSDGGANTEWYDTYDPENTLDADYTTSSAATCARLKTGSPENRWIKYDFGVDGLILDVGHISWRYDANGVPFSGKFQISNDDATWEDISADTASGGGAGTGNWADAGQLEDGPIRFRYLRFLITSTASTSAYFRALQLGGYTVTTAAMSAVSTSVEAETQPDTVIVSAQQINLAQPLADPASAPAPADYTLYASRDDGVTWSTATTTVSEWGGKHILQAEIDVSGQPAGTTMRYKINSLSTTHSYISHAAMNWS